MVHHEARTLLPPETTLLPNQPNVDFDAVLLIYAILRPVHSLSSPTPIAWVSAVLGTVFDLSDPHACTSPVHAYNSSRDSHGHHGQPPHTTQEAEEEERCRTGKFRTRLR